MSQMDPVSHPIAAGGKLQPLYDPDRISRRNGWIDGYDKTLTEQNLETEKLEKAFMRLQTKRCQTWELAERVRKACKTSVVCFSLPEATIAARNTAHRKLRLNCWWSNCIVGRCSSLGNTHTNPLPNKRSIERDCVFPQSHFSCGFVHYCFCR